MIVTSVHHKINQKKKNPGPVFLFFGEFSQPDDPKKKKGWRIQQMDF
jgi:hypothetical protein